MSFTELYASEAHEDEAPPAPVKSVKRAPPKTALSSFELQAALIGFSTRARTLRGHAHVGEAMSTDELENWNHLLDAIDSFLVRQAQETSSYDVIRTRVTTEAELELDGRTYGAVPNELPDQVLERVGRLAMRMAELRQLQVQPKDEAPRFAWPIESYVVTSLFGRRFHPILKEYRQHLGIDLAAESGQLVTAAAKGTVVRAGWSGGHGCHVEIQHAGNVLTGYSHLVQTLVEPGTVVAQGDPIGLAGSTGQSTGVHLHFELWREGKPCDPLEWLSRPPVRMAPLVSRE